MALIGITTMSAAYEGEELVVRVGYVVYPNGPEQRIPMDFQISGGLTLIVNEMQEHDLGFTFTDLAAGTGQSEIPGELRGACPVNYFKQQALDIGINHYGADAGPEIPQWADEPVASRPFPADSVHKYFADLGQQIQFRVFLTATPDMGPGQTGLSALFPEL